MPQPELIEAGAGHEILPRTFPAQQRRKGVEPVHCFTWNIEFARHPGAGGRLVHQAALRRAWTRIAAKAAGVTPRIRAAAPSVEGRAALSRSTISFERPGSAA